VSEMKRYDPPALLEKYGLTPAQYPDFAALRGDPSDNLPGIPGVGEKTATKWITEFGSLQALVDRVDEVKGKAGDALRAHLGNVLRNRQLTALVTDMPAETVGAVPGDLLPVAWDRDRIHQLFDTPEFRVLRERRYQAPPHRLPGRPRPPPGPGPAHRGRRTRPRGLAGRPGAPEGAARRQGPDARADGSRPAASRPGLRHGGGRLPGAAGPAHLRPGRPGAA